MYKYIMFSLLLFSLLQLSCSSLHSNFNESDFELVNEQYHIYIEKTATNNQKLYVMVELPNRIEAFVNCIFNNNMQYVGLIATIKSYKFYVYKEAFKCSVGYCNGLIKYDKKHIYLESTLCAVSHELCHLWLYKYYNDQHTDPRGSKCDACYK